MEAHFWECASCGAKFYEGNLQERIRDFVKAARGMRNRVYGPHGFDDFGEYPGGAVPMAWLEAHPIFSGNPEVLDFQQLAEQWWNEDPEMRYIEIMCGEMSRFHVRLQQIITEEPGTFEVGRGEDGSLLKAMNNAIRKIVKDATS